MLHRLDLVLIVILLLGACGHIVGSLSAYPAGSEILVYTLGVAGLGWICGLPNLLRSRRPADRPVAMLALFSSLIQAAVALAWGSAIRHPADPRPIGFVASAGGLVAFSAAATLYRPVSARLRS